MPKVSRVASMGCQTARKRVWNVSDSWEMGSHQRFCRRGKTHQELCFKVIRLSSGPQTPAGLFPMGPVDQGWESQVGGWDGKREKENKVPISREQTIPTARPVSRQKEAPRRLIGEMRPE